MYFSPEGTGYMLECLDYLNCQIIQNLFSSTVLWHKKFLLTSTAIPCIKQMKCIYSVTARTLLFFMQAHFEKKLCIILKGYSMHL